MSVYDAKFIPADVITYVHYPDLSHAFVQMTAHSKRCLESTQEVARLLGKGLAKA